MRVQGTGLQPSAGALSTLQVWLLSACWFSLFSRGPDYRQGTERQIRIWGEFCSNKLSYQPLDSSGHPSPMVKTWYEVDTTTAYFSWFCSCQQNFLLQCPSLCSAWLLLSAFSVYCELWLLHLVKFACSWLHNTVNVSSVNSKADDPSPRILTSHRLNETKCRKRVIAQQSP